MSVFKTYETEIDYDFLHLLSFYRSVIMGFAALWILIFHTWDYIFPTTPYIGFIESYIVTIGFSGVDMFFLVSGFGLTYSIKNHSVGNFYINRFKKLLPAYFFTAFLRTYIDNWTFSTFILNVIGYNFFTKSIYSFQWYIIASIIFYLIFPIFYKHLKQAKNLSYYYCISLLIIYISLILSKNYLRHDLYAFAGRLPVFITGIYFGWASQNRKIIISYKNFMFFAIILVSGIYLAYLTCFLNPPSLVHISNCFIPSTFIAVSLSIFISYFFEFIIKKFKFKFIGAFLYNTLSFLGTISLELYCIQEALDIFLNIYLESIISITLIRNFIFIAIVIILSYIMKWFITLCVQLLAKFNILT